MRRDQATDIATRIAEIWPRGGISTQVWESELFALDHQRTRQAFAELKRTESHSPSMAAFYVRYHATAGPAAARVECDRCDGSGWDEVTDDRRHAPHCTRPGTYGDPDDCCCHAVEPCRCVAGQQAAATADRVARHTRRDVDL